MLLYLFYLEAKIELKAIGPYYLTSRYPVLHLGELCIAIPTFELKKKYISLQSAL